MINDNSLEIKLIYHNIKRYQPELIAENHRFIFDNDWDGDQIHDRSSKKYYKGYNFCLTFLHGFSIKTTPFQ